MQVNIKQYLQTILLNQGIQGIAKLIMESTDPTLLDYIEEIFYSELMSDSIAPEYEDVYYELTEEELTELTEDSNIARYMELLDLIDKYHLN